MTNEGKKDFGVASIQVSLNADPASAYITVFQGPTLRSTVPGSELMLFQVSPLWNSHIMHVLDVGGS